MTLLVRRHSLVALFAWSTSLACVVETQLGDDAASSDDGDTIDPSDLSFENAPAVLAEARCAAYFACNCADVLGASTSPKPIVPEETQAECEASRRMAFETQFANSQSAGLTYDPACVEAYLAYYAEPGCPAMSEARAIAFDDVMHCSFFHGDDVAGTACEVVALVSPGATNCGPGLSCTGESCEARKADGEVCATTGPFSDCAYNSFCDPSVSPTRCAPLPRPGEPCLEDGLCIEDAYCFDGTCVAKTAPGEFCNFGICSYGLCEPVTSTCNEVPVACTPWLTELEDPCESTRRIVDGFIEDNSQCEVSDDCVQLSALCYDHTTCGSVALNRDYDPDQWNALDTALNDSCTDCGGDPCGFPVACVDGVCTIGP